MSEVWVDIDLTQFEAKLDQVLVETELMNDRVENTEEESDRVRQKVQQLRSSSDLTFRQILTGARRTSQLVQGLAVASGDALGQIFAANIEAAFLIAELYADIAALEALTPFGALQAGAKVLLIVSLIRQAQLLKQEQSELAARQQGWITILTAVSY